MSTIVNQKKLIDDIIDIAYQAGQTILDIYQAPSPIFFKEDQSPVTQADMAAHTLIHAGLKNLGLNIPIISEEDEIKSNKTNKFWLVDPLDGTKEFINRNDEFTINIALIENNLPLLGIVYAPALNLLYAGIVGQGSFKVSPEGQRFPIYVQSAINKEIIVVCSRSHHNESETEKFLSSFTVKTNILRIGSSLKFCKIAEGSAHLYPRFGRTMEWDTAAGQAILMAAGGSAYSLAGSPLTYGKKSFENPHFIASSSPAFFLSGQVNCHA